MASSSSVSVFDNYRFQSAFNEELYNTIVKNKKVIAEKEQEQTLRPERNMISNLTMSLLTYVCPVQLGNLARVNKGSEIPVIRAILIHCIMNGEDVRADEIIADKMVKMVQGIKEKGKLGFPSTIYKLCKDAGVPLREFRRTKKIPAEKPIIARRMESTRLPRIPQHQPQDNEDEDQPMPQAEEGHEEEQGEEHDY
ncbi:hypothetical protein PIB30_102521 [Stylosanthes scabra]|uniref:Uncharacterized protein n=1 Tax=Stylosanthes scabra TaxID=79078 RepID=A0ABU6RY72_9FABA|nr:hypothetical protein [Stylosanthes scabra]